MFKCKQCQSTEFRLMLQPSFEGQVEISTNADQEVVVIVNGKTFVADLMFMNNFAFCAQCESIQCWEYYFKQTDETTQAETA